MDALGDVLGRLWASWEVWARLKSHQARLGMVLGRLGDVLRAFGRAPAVVLREFGGKKACPNQPRSVFKTDLACD